MGGKDQRMNEENSKVDSGAGEGGCGCKSAPQDGGCRCKRLWIVLAVVIAVGVVAAARGPRSGGAPSCAASVCALPAATAGVTRAVAVVSNAAAVVPAAIRPRLVDLGAGKCIPCKMMAPILDELRKTFATVLDVQFVDVWENPDAGKPYGIRLIPTQIFYDAGGKELFRHEGFFSREDILAKWKELGFAFAATNAVPAR